MTFELGHKPDVTKTSRRGSENLRSIEGRAKVERLCNILEKYQEEDVDQLTPSERVHIWTDLQEFRVAKIARVEFKQAPVDDDELAYTPEQRKEQINYLLDRLTQIGVADRKAD